MKLINGLIALIVIGSIILTVVLAISPPNKKNKDNEKDERLKNEKTADITIDVDSSQLQIDRIVKLFNCDTTSIGDFMDFTYKKNEKLSSSEKPRLFVIMVNDIYRSENDSSLILSATNFTNSYKGLNSPLLSNTCEFTIKYTNIIDNINKFNFVICVVANPKLVRLKTYEIETSSDYYSEQNKISIEYKPSSVIKGECVYMEKKL